jgi:hypothetical protein
VERGFEDAAYQAVLGMLLRVRNALEQWIQNARRRGSVGMAWCCAEAATWIEEGVVRFDPRRVERGPREQG